MFPRTVFSWNIESVDTITSDSLCIFSVVQPKVDTLIIGTGEFETTTHIGKNLLEIAQKHKINVEILTTELVCLLCFKRLYFRCIEFYIHFQACTQFNYLSSEGRMVAAALVPPRGTRFGDDDIFNTLNFDNKLFTLDNMHTPEIKKGLKKY